MKKNTYGDNKDELFGAPPKRPWQAYVWVALSLILTGAFLWPARASKTQATDDPIAIPLDVPWETMVQNVSNLADKYDGDVGIYIKDLKTGKSFERAADRPFVAASLIKIPIMLSTFRAIQENKLSLDARIKLARHNKKGGSGDLRLARTGRAFSTYDVLYKMMTKSDNTAASMLIEKLGYNYINKVCEQTGLAITRIDPVGMSIAEWVDPSHDNYTTPREMGYMLEKIYRHDTFGDGESDLMIQIMRHAEGRSRLSRFLPKTWVMARKGGLVRRNCHDVGLVFTPKSDYLICVLTANNRNYNRAKGFIAKVGQKAYSYLGNS